VRGFVWELWRSWERGWLGRQGLSRGAGMLRVWEGGEMLFQCKSGKPLAGAVSKAGWGVCCK